MRKSYSFLYSGFTFLALFLVFSIVLKLVDYRAIGPMGTFVGLASLNEEFAQQLPFNVTWFTISEICGYLNLLVAASFAITGLVQFIKRRNFFKVDTEIRYLGYLYVVVILFYLFFDRFVINYRPILEADGTLEASFPSSHTLLTISIMASAAFIISRVFPKRSKAKGILSFLCMFVLALSVVSRTLSGVHWITDVFGGILLGCAVSFVFAGFIFRLDEEEEYL